MDKGNRPPPDRSPPPPSLKHKPSESPPPSLRVEGKGINLEAGAGALGERVLPSRLKVPLRYKLSAPQPAPVAPSAPVKPSLPAEPLSPLSPIGP